MDPIYGRRVSLVTVDVESQTITTVVGNDTVVAGGLGEDFVKRICQMMGWPYQNGTYEVFDV